MERQPGDCPHEVKTLVMGKQVKSLCDLRGHEIWTNCRYHERCTLNGLSNVQIDADDDEVDEEGEPETVEDMDTQLTIFDLMDRGGR